MINNGPEATLRMRVNDEVRTKNSPLRRNIGTSSGHGVIGRMFMEENERYCLGMVDELMLWNRSLTTQEVDSFMSLY